MRHKEVGGGGVGGGGEEEELLCTLMRYPIPLNILTYSVFNGIHALGLKMT